MSVAAKCVYCMGPNATSGRCCCPEHARKVSSALAYHRRRCRVLLDRIAAKRHGERVRERCWRDLAQGRAPDVQLERLFGLAGLDVDRGA